VLFDNRQDDGFSLISWEKNTLKDWCLREFAVLQSLMSSYMILNSIHCNGASRNCSADFKFLQFSFILRG